MQVTERWTSPRPFKGSTLRSLKRLSEMGETAYLHSSVVEAREREEMIERHSRRAIQRRYQHDLLRGFLPLARGHNIVKTIEMILFQHTAILLRRWHKHTLFQMDKAHLAKAGRRAAASLKHFALRRAWSSLADTRLFRVLRRAVQAVQQSARRRAINSWMMRREARRGRLTAISGAVRLWGRRGCARSWRVWRALCAGRATLTAALHRLKHRSSALAMQAWHERLQARTHAMQLLSKGGAAIRMRALRACANTWRDAATARRLHLRWLRAGVAAFTRRLLRNGFNSYRDFADEGKYRQRLLRSGVSAFTSSQIRRAANAWADNAVEAKLRIRMLAAAIGAIANMWARRATNTWHAYSGARAAATRKLRAAATTMLARQVRRGWNQWRPLAMKRRVLRAAMHSLVYRGLRIGLSTWRQLALARRRAMRLMRACVSALANMQVRRAANTWRSFAFVRAEAMRLLRKHASAISNRKLWRTYRIWYEVKKARLASLRLLELAIRSVVRSRARRAANTWSAYVRERTVSMRKITACIGALRYRDQARGLRTWRSLGRERARHQTLFRVLQGSGTLRELFGAFQIWARTLRPNDTVKQRLRTTMNLAAQRLLERTHSGMMRLALHTWNGSPRVRASRAVRIWRRHLPSVRLRATIHFWRSSWFSHLHDEHKAEMIALETRLAGDASDAGEKVIEARREVQEALAAHASAMAQVDDSISARLHAEGEVTTITQATAREVAAAQEAQRAAEARASEADARIAELESTVASLIEERAIAGLASVERHAEHAELSAASQAAERAAAARARDSHVITPAPPPMATPVAPPPMVTPVAASRAPPAPSTTIAPVVAPPAEVEEMLPMATISLTPNMASRLVSAHLRLDHEHADAPQRPRAALTKKAKSIAKSTHKPRPSRSPPDHLRQPHRVTSPTNASRGWRMDFSPDWKADSNPPEAWAAYKNEFVGRTAARHHPWAAAEQRVPRSAVHVPSSAVPAPLSGGGERRAPPSGGGERRVRVGSARSPRRGRSARERPTSPRVDAWAATESDGYDSDGALTAGRHTWASDRHANLAYRSGYAWTQHEFPGEHVKRRV